jgi:predicted NBD/HSP70 family sugar kinase
MASVKGSAAGSPGATGAPLARRRALADGIRTDVFATVLARGTLSRAQIAQALDTSASTVTKAVTPLIADGYLEEVEPAPVPALGRPSMGLRVQKDRHAVVGIKVRQDRLIGVVTDLRTDVLDYREVPLETHSPDATLKAVAELARDLAASDRAMDDYVLGLGVSISGHVDAAQQTSRYSALLGWHDVEISSRLLARTGLPTVVSNDVNALAVGERWFGEGRGCDSFAVVTVGTGIGSGLFLNGRLHTGVTGLAGEIGHVPVQPGGPRCNCGKRGCLEAIASFGAILRSISERGGPEYSDIDKAIELARSDRGPAGTAAVAAFAEAGDALGRALAWLCNMLNPEKLILAGEGVRARRLFGPSMDRAMRAHSFSTAVNDCEVIPRLLDDSHWARGAACLVIDAEIGSSA